MRELNVVRRLRIAVGAAALMNISSVRAQGVQNFCAAATSEANRAAYAAAKAVFPGARLGSSDNDCIYPFKLLRYADADVLLTLHAVPFAGELCHGCSGTLSAYVLLREPSGPRVVARFVDFGGYGTFGNPGDVAAVEIAGNDAMVIESGGTFQGYSASSLSILLFRSGRLDKIGPALAFAASNAGAATDPKQAVQVNAAWRVDQIRPDVLTIDYKVEEDGRLRRAKASWQVVGGQFVLRSGNIPEEFDVAAGNK